MTYSRREEEELASHVDRAERPQRTGTESRRPGGAAPKGKIRLLLGDTREAQTHSSQHDDSTVTTRIHHPTGTAKTVGANRETSKL